MNLLLRKWGQKSCSITKCRIRYFINCKIKVWISAKSHVLKMQNKRIFTTLLPNRIPTILQISPQVIENYTVIDVGIFSHVANSCKYIITTCKLLNKVHKINNSKHQMTVLYTVMKTIVSYEKIQLTLKFLYK